MSNIKFANFAHSSLASGIDAVQTTLTVSGGHGSRFPTITGAEYFYVTLENASLSREIVKVTSVSVDTFTVIRGQDNTTGLPWNAGDIVSLRLNAAAIGDILDVFPGTVNVQQFSGTGSQTAFTLALAPSGKNAVDIYINGVYQQKATYSIAGTTLTFTEAPPTGTDNIEVQIFVTTAINATDANLVSYIPAGTGAVATNVQDKLRESVSVKDFGAVGDGVTDDTLAFSIAAKNAPASVNITGAEASLPRALMCRLYVPAGSYIISEEIDTGNREIIWELDSAAAITNYSYLNGEVYRIAQRQSDYHHGTTDYACTYSIRSNGNLEGGAEVLGITAPSELASYSDRDSVSLYVDNNAPAALVDVSTAAYTSTTALITVPSTAVLKNYRRGMIIDTKHSPKWSGIVDSWNADGSILTVTAWYRYGEGDVPSTPTNGTGLVLNGFTKIWAHNSNVYLNPSSYASKASGFELGVFNNKGVLDFANRSNYIWGYDAVNLGTYEGAVGFIARNATAKFFRGFQCDDAVQVGFYVAGTPSKGFWSEQTTGDPFYYTKAGVAKFKVTSEGDVISNSMTLGSTSSANTPYIDLNSSGNVVDYDVRLIASGGTSSAGNGVLTITAGAGTRFEGVIQSTQDNLHANGTPANRWSVVYAATATISTSDFREKQQVRDLLEAEKATARRLKTLVKAFKFNDAVQAKGDSARIHFGVIAQDVKDAFEAEGLVAENYAMLCYDEWDEIPEKRDDSGLVIQPYIPAGNRYGVRYEELLAFIIAVSL